MTDARADELESKLAQGDKLTPSDVKGGVVGHGGLSADKGNAFLPALTERRGVQSFWVSVAGSSLSGTASALGSSCASRSRVSRVMAPALRLDLISQW